MKSNQSVSQQKPKTISDKELDAFAKIIQQKALSSQHASQSQQQREIKEVQIKQKSYKQSLNLLKFVLKYSLILGRTKKQAQNKRHIERGNQKEVIPKFVQSQESSQNSEENQLQHSGESQEGSIHEDAYQFENQLQEEILRMQNYRINQQLSKNEVDLRIKNQKNQQIQSKPNLLGQKKKLPFEQKEVMQKKQKETVQGRGQKKQKETIEGTCQNLYSFKMINQKQPASSNRSIQKEQIIQEKKGSTAINTNQLKSLNVPNKNQFKVQKIQSQNKKNQPKNTQVQPKALINQNVQKSTSQNQTHNKPIQTTETKSITSIKKQKQPQMKKQTKQNPQQVTVPKAVDKKIQQQKKQSLSNQKNKSPSQNISKKQVQSKPNTQKKQVFMNAIQIKTKLICEQFKRRQNQKKVWKQILKRKDIPILNKQYIESNIFQEYLIQEAVLQIIVDKFDQIKNESKNPKSQKGSDTNNDFKHYTVQQWNQYEQIRQKQLKKEILLESHNSAIQNIKSQFNDLIPEDLSFSKLDKKVKQLALKKFMKIKLMVKYTTQLIQKVLLKQCKTAQAYLQGRQLHKNRFKQSQKIQKLTEKIQKSKISLKNCFEVIHRFYSCPMITILDRKASQISQINNQNIEKYSQRLQQIIHISQKVFQNLTINKVKIFNKGIFIQTTTKQSIQLTLQKYVHLVNKFSQRWFFIQTIQKQIEAQKKTYNVNVAVKNTKINLKQFNAKVSEFLFQDEQAPAFAPSQGSLKLTIKRQEDPEDIPFKMIQLQQKRYLASQKLWQEYGWKGNDNFKVHIQTPSEKQSLEKKRESMRLSKNKRQKEIIPQSNVLTFQSQQAKFDQLTAFLLFNPQILQKFTNEQVLYITNRQFRKRHQEKLRFEAQQKTNQRRLRQLYLTGLFNSLNIQESSQQKSQLHRAYEGDFSRLNDQEKYYLTQQFKKMRIKKGLDPLSNGPLTQQQKAYMETKWRERQYALKQIQEFRQKQMRYEIKANLNQIIDKRWQQKNNQLIQKKEAPEKFDELALIQKQEEQEELQNQRAYYQFKHETYFNQESTKAEEVYSNSQKISKAKKQDKQGVSLRRMKQQTKEQKIEEPKPVTKDEWWLQKYGKRSKRSVDQMEFYKYGWLYRKI